VTDAECPTPYEILNNGIEACHFLGDSTLDGMIGLVTYRGDQRANILGDPVWEHNTDPRSADVAPTPHLRRQLPDRQKPHGYEEPDYPYKFVSGLA